MRKLLATLTLAVLTSACTTTTRHLVPPGGRDAQAKAQSRIVVSRKLASGGAGLVETFATPSGRETITAYHPDSSSVVLTHYCGQGSRPQLEVEESVAAGAEATGPSALTVRLTQNAFDQAATYQKADAKLNATALPLTVPVADPPSK